ncbi:acyl-CoA dehydrogenase family protein [Arthrobacter sp. MI7-26]|uniref:acyl-CoA dehydrogenase family protein n=1 Tax=Arthrobacter sp. MI7-26 TaxID=2993653 RepID=UPI0022491A1F|nr:acyl-CoA dehydrogenase family protein [Arthrobacter sp. MI7-26]MCX2750039.1 acyl-CoA dehydrogenase family protein [Arthrobacter sp. MI7-26]
MIDTAGGLLLSCDEHHDAMFHQFMAGALLMSKPGIRPEITEIVEQIDALRPMLIEKGQEGDERRRIADDVFHALAATGAFSISAPPKFGGLAANTLECHKVARAIARGDGGAGWVAGILDSGAWVLSLMDTRAQEDVWGGEAGVNSFVSIVLATSSEAEPVAGGFKVSGRWGYGTGSLHAHWSLLGIPLTDEDGRAIDAGLALIPSEDLTSEDNWFVAGMKSSGSVTQIASDVFVPEHRIFPLTAAVEGGYLGHNSEQTYQTVFVPSLFMKLIGPHLGMARAALDYVVDKADSKAIAYTGYEKQAEAVSFQLAIARASMQLNAAEVVAGQVANEIYEGAGRGYYAPYGERIEMRAKAGWIVETITATMDQLLTAHGSAGFAESSLLQRMWRDQATAARHGHTLAVSGYEAFGKVIFGRQDEARRVLPIV